MTTTTPYVRFYSRVNAAHLRQQQRQNIFEYIEAVTVGANAAARLSVSVVIV